MPEYTLRIRRYDPQSGDAAYWDDHVVDLKGTQSVLDALLQIRDEKDGSVGIRCSCQQAICGSCGVRVNGKPALACNTHLEDAAKREYAADGPPRDGDGPPIVTVEPMGNMPVIRDLIVDMDAVHWKKIRRVTPWLLNKQPVPEREYIVPHESMIDITQTMACIQCGACVSDCLSMEIDPLFIGPAALAKAYRFVGDPRDAEHQERLKDLSEDEHGIYDCTHCFNCIEACPKDVAPMSQIMRLRRVAGSDFEIDDRNNGHRHEKAFVKQHRAQRAAARGRPAAGFLRRQVPPARRARAGRLAPAPRRRPCCGARVARQGAAASAQGDPRPSSRSSSGSRARASASSSTSTSSATRTNLSPSRPRRRPRRPRSPTNPRRSPARAKPPSRPPKASRHEGRLLARLREPRVHA